MSEWNSLPDDERLEWLAWDTYQQDRLRAAYERILQDNDNKVDPATYILLVKGELGL